MKNILAKSGAYGFDAEKGEYGDMIKAGIVDPTKVVRTALQNAASVAGLLITTDACIATKPEPKDEDGGHGHGAPGMGGMGGMGGGMGLGMGGMDVTFSRRRHGDAFWPRAIGGAAYERQTN